MAESLPSVLVIGSSTTIRFGPHLKRMLGGLYRYWRIGEEPPQVRATFAKPDDFPPGCAAGDSSRVLTYLHELERVPEFRPDVVLLNVGLHDIKRNPHRGGYQVPPHAYRENVTAIVDWFARAGLNLVWVNNGPIHEEAHNRLNRSALRFSADLYEYNEIAEGIVSDRGIPILPLREFMRTMRPLGRLLVDHIHYNDDVYRQQAAFIAGYLASVRSDLP